MTDPEPKRDSAVRWAIMFVIAWLIALYVFEIVKSAFNPSAGYAAAAVVWAINIFARYRAGKSIKANAGYYFWMSLPVVLFLVVPTAVKVVEIARAGAERTWWYHVKSLGPFIVQLGVPVVVLAWAYIAIGVPELPKEVGRAPDQSDAQHSA